MRNGNGDGTTNEAAVPLPDAPIDSGAELARRLAAAIAAGELPVGARLPTEFELCERHGLSRYAVRKALDGLQELGLISRRKNAGTRVEAATPRPGFTQSLATLDELAQFGSEHVRVVQDVRTIVADLSLAGTLGCAGGTRWLRISSLRLDSPTRPRPLGWTDVYVDEQYVEVGDLVRRSPQVLVSSLIEQRWGRAIARIQQQVRAIALPKELAGPLQADAGTPALQVTRRYLDADDVLFEASVTVHPADRFTFESELRRAATRELAA